MGRKNEYYFKKAEKAERNRYALEYELFDVCIGTNKFNIFTEDVVQNVKYDSLRFQHLRNGYEEVTANMSKIVEQRKVTPLIDDFFRP